MLNDNWKFGIFEIFASLEVQAADDMNRLTLRNVRKLNCQQRTEISSFSRKESHRESLMTGVVCYRAEDDLFIDRMLSIAVNVDSSRLVRIQDHLPDFKRQIQIFQANIIVSF